MFMQFCQLVSWKGLSRWEKVRKKEWGEWRTSPGRVPLKIGSNLPTPALLSSAKLCLCSPFQGTPGVLASIRCAQNALRCHLFKHSEPLANRDKPLFIKPLILAARMTTWLALKGALKSFIGMGGGNLYREGDSSLTRRELWRMNSEARWGTVSSMGLMKGRDWLDVQCVTDIAREKGKAREIVWLGTMGEKLKEWGWQQERACDWGVVAEIGTRWGHKWLGHWKNVEWVGENIVIKWRPEQMKKLLKTRVGDDCMFVYVCADCWGVGARVCVRSRAPTTNKWMSEAQWERLSERVMGVSDGCVDRKCQL